MIELRENYWAVEVPDDANGFKITDKSIGFYDGDPSLKDIRFIHLPPGTWEIICTSREVTRGHAHEIVEWFEIAGRTGYRDYSYIDDLRYPFIDPLNSLISLLTSKGCDLTKNYLIIKKTA